MYVCVCVRARVCVCVCIYVHAAYTSEHLYRHEVAPRIADRVKCVDLVCFGSTEDVEIRVVISRASRLLAVRRFF